VFVQDFAVVDEAYEAIASRIAVDTTERFRRALEVAQFEKDRLQAMIAPPHWPSLLASTVEVTLGPSRPYQDGMLVSFTWRAHDAAPTSLTVDADLQVAPIGLDCTQLLLRGRYYPPAALDGEHDNWFLVQRLADASTRSFLTGIVGDLAGTNPTAH